MSTALPPLPTITEILLDKEQGPLSMEQVWQLRFHVTKIKPHGVPSLYQNAVGNMIRYFVIAAHKGNVRRAVDLKDVILWCIDYVENGRKRMITPINIHWSHVNGYVVGDGVLNDERIINAIMDLAEKEVHFAIDVINTMAPNLRKFYDI